MSEKRGNKRKSKSKELTPNLTKDELLRRLKTIQEELSNVDQDDNAVNYDDLAANLASNFLLKHKEKDVKAYVACCFADILRIYVPEPPYNELELKAIFTLMVNQLKNLESPESALYKKAYYLLESLGMVQSFNICCEMDFQDIILQLFKNIFHVVNEKHQMKVKNLFLDVMAGVMRESESLSQEIIDAVLVNLVEPRKSSKPSSYQLAASFIQRCNTALEPYLQVIFNDFLVLQKETESHLEKHTYDLILELNKISKTILVSVLPQLEFKLKSVEEHERLEVVKVLGLMFCEENSDLSTLNNRLWKSFLNRFNDISPEVRMECVQISKKILVSKPDLIIDFEDCLQVKFHDHEEKVRLEAVISVCEAAAEKLDVIPKKLLDSVKERMRDKKWSVRRAALTCTAKLYKSLTIGQNLDVSENEKINWAPDKLLQSYYQNSIEDRLCVEKITHGCLVPVNLPAEDKMKVLFKLYASLKDYALKAFDALLNFRSSINNEFKQLLELHQNEAEGREGFVFKKILSLARNLPEPMKAQENLKKFVNMFSDKTLFQSLLSATDVNNGCETVRKSVADIVKRISSKNPIIDTVKALLDRSCHMLVDSQSLLILLKYVKQSVEGMDDEDDDEFVGYHLSDKAKRGLLLIKCLANVLPEIFSEKECFEELLQLIKHQNDFVIETGLRILYHVGDKLEKFDGSLTSCFQPVLSKLATNGTREQGIYAIRCLSKILKDSTFVMDRLFNALYDSLNYKSPKLLTTLASLGEIASCAPSIFESKQKQVVDGFVVKELLIVDRENMPPSQESEDEWGEDDEITREAKLKVQGIKLMVKWLLGLQLNHKISATPVFRIFDEILKKDGDLSGNNILGMKDKARIRLAAANGLVNLVQDRNYVDVITSEQYQQLSLTVMDSCYNVRQKFSIKLHKALELMKLPLDYLAFFMLSAADPAKDRKMQARQMISKNAQTRRDLIKQNSSAAAHLDKILPEYALPYVIYLMAHHPDFSPKSKEAMKVANDYLWFFIEPLLGNKAENASFLKKLANNIKQHVDAHNPESESANEKLYVICDLVIWLLENKTHSTILKDSPGKPILPKKLFKASKRQGKTNTKNYLPAGFTAASLNIKAKKPIEIRTTANKKKNLSKSKETPTKRTTRVRTKGREFRKAVKKLDENESESELSPDDQRDSDRSDDDADSTSESGDKAPEPIQKSRRLPSLSSESSKTDATDKKPKEQTTLDAIFKKGKKQKPEVEAEDDSEQDIGDLDSSRLSDDPDDVADDDSRMSPEKVTTSPTLQETSIVKSKTKSNVRVAVPKRHLEVADDSVAERTTPRKKAKATQPEMPDDISPVEEIETSKKEVTETKSSEEETVENETSAVLNVKRKRKRR